MVVEIVWRNSRRSRTNICRDMRLLTQKQLTPNFLLGHWLLFISICATLTIPTVHEFGNFGLREGRKIHFRFMANFKSGLFFSAVTCDWILGWNSTTYIGPRPSVVCVDYHVHGFWRWCGFCSPEPALEDVSTGFRVPQWRRGTPASARAHSFVLMNVEIRRM